MIDPEPYVADPAEPPATPRLVRLRPVLATVAALLLAASFGYLALHDTAQQDPALGSGQGQDQLHGGAFALAATWR